MTLAPTASRLKAVLKPLLKVLVSVGLVTLIVHKTDTRGIIDRVMGLNLMIALAAATFLSALAVLPALRWKVLTSLGGTKFGLAPFYRLVMIGNLLSQAIPSVGADGVRAWYLHRQGMGLAAAVNSVLLDRLTALGSVLLLTMSLLPWLSEIVPPVVVWWLIGMAIVAATGLLIALIAIRFIPRRWSQLRVVLMVRHLSDAGRALLKDPTALMLVVALSILVQLLLPVLVYVLAAAVNAPFALFDCIMLFPLVMLVSMAPIAIAGWGVREGAMVVAFGVLNVPARDALVVSILFGLVVAASTAPGLVFWLTMGRELKMELRTRER